MASVCEFSAKFFYTDVIIFFKCFLVKQFLTMIWFVNISSQVSSLHVSGIPVVFPSLISHRIPSGFSSQDFFNCSQLDSFREFADNFPLLRQRFPPLGILSEIPSAIFPGFSPAILLGIFLGYFHLFLPGCLWKLLPDFFTDYSKDFSRDCSIDSSRDSSRDFSRNSFRDVFRHSFRNSFHNNASRIFLRCFS